MTDDLVAPWTPSFTKRCLVICLYPIYNVCYDKMREFYAFASLDFSATRKTRDLLVFVELSLN